MVFAVFILMIGTVTSKVVSVFYDVGSTFVYTGIKQNLLIDT